VTARAPIDLAALVGEVRGGRPRAVGRLLSLVENDDPALPEVMSELAVSTGHAQVVGLTGAPGVGKSTTTAALVRSLRAAGQRVGVLAVDPSSPFSGGALLGDRVRMQEHALDEEVFIRSMATRGHLGGLAVAVPQALRVFDAASCDTVLLETVGVGQSEVEVAGVADVTLVLLAPGAGDGIQAAKAGVLEIGDIFVVNKADREGTQALVREIRGMIALGSTKAWKPPILLTVAVRGEGIEELQAALEKYRARAEETGRWATRRLERARREVEGLVLARLRADLRTVSGADLDAVAALVRDGRLTAHQAAERMLTGL